jgi:membrane protein
VLGGVVGGTVWLLAQWIFTGIQGASTYYNAIYGALYHLLFLFIWLFWCWLILLFGTEVAFAHQNLDSLTRQYRRPLAPPDPVDDYLCLAALVRIGERFLKQQPPLSRDELRQMLPRGNNLVDRVTQALQESNLVVEVVPDRPGSSPQFLPKLPLNLVTVKEVLNGLRKFRGAGLDVALAGDPRLIALLKPLAEVPAPGEWEKLTLQQLVESLPGDEGLTGPAVE